MAITTKKVPKVKPPGRSTRRTDFIQKIIGVRHNINNNSKAGTILIDICSFAV